MWMHDIARWRQGEITDDQLRSRLRAMARLAGILARDGRIRMDSDIYMLRLNSRVCGWGDLARIVDGFAVD